MINTLFNHKTREKIMNDTNDDIHPDIEDVLMDHVDYKEHMKKTRVSLKDFYAEKEAQYKPKDALVDPK
jgi:hypothetical protein